MTKDIIEKKERHEEEKKRNEEERRRREEKKKRLETACAEKTMRWQQELNSWEEMVFVVL